MSREEAIKNIKEHCYFANLIPPAKEALDMAIKALEQEPCDDVSEINDGNIYECPCGYGWDKNKVVRHHFCPNCGRAVDGSIKIEQEPCEDAVSRQAVIDTIDKWVKNMHVLITLPANEVTPLFESVHELPSVTPQPKMGRWITLKDEYGDVTEAVCSNCDKNGNHKWAFCPYCGQPKMQEVE